MLFVSQVLASKKSPEVHTVAHDASAHEARAMLVAQDLGALVVTEHDCFIGMITERDYVRKIVPHDGPAARPTRVRDIMSARLPFVTPETSIEECMMLMTNLRVRHLPVLSGNRLVGILSMGDVVKTLLGEKDSTIEELVRYITDSPMVMQAHGATRYTARPQASPS